MPSYPESSQPLAIISNIATISYAELAFFIHSAQQQVAHESQIESVYNVGQSLIHPEYQKSISLLMSKHLGEYNILWLTWFMEDTGAGLHHNNITLYGKNHKICSLLDLWNICFIHTPEMLHVVGFHPHPVTTFDTSKG